MSIIKLAFTIGSFTCLVSQAAVPPYQNRVNEISAILNSPLVKGKIETLVSRAGVIDSVVLNKTGKTPASVTLWTVSSDKCNLNVQVTAKAPGLPAPTIYTVTGVSEPVCN